MKAKINIANLREQLWMWTEELTSNCTKDRRLYCRARLRGYVSTLACIGGEEIADLRNLAETVIVNTK